MAASSEDGTILAVIESLERAAAERGPRRGDEAAETLERLYVELLGVLSYDLAPVPPPPEVKQRLMAAIAGDETQEVPDPPLSPPAPLALVPPLSPLAPTTPIAPLAHPPLPAPLPAGAEAGGAGKPVSPNAGMEPRAERPAREAPAGRVQVVDWRHSQFRLAGLLAAVLILALLGLTGRLAYLLFAQRDTIASLTDRLQAERRAGHSLPATRDARQLRQQLDEMREKLALVTSPAVTVSALRPAAALPGQPAPHGILFVAADHQHWMLSVSGLEPSSRGRCYQLWFIDDAGPHSGGIFHVAAEGPVELSSPRMPPGTRDARITIEPNPGSAIPSGPEVLAAGQFQTL